MVQQLALFDLPTFTPAIAPELIMVHGGNADTPALCEAAGWEYGVQFGYKAFTAPYMVDYVQGDWQAYLDFLRENKPKIALVMDVVEDTYEAKREAGRRLFDAGAIVDVPMIAWKIPTAPSGIPRHLRYNSGRVVAVRLAISVPTPTYLHLGDRHTIPTIDELCEPDGYRWPIHLLGGSPDQWRWLIEYYSPVADVMSIDGNTALAQARRGKYWSVKGKWVETRNETVRTDTDELIIRTMQNTRRYLGDISAPVLQSVRIDRCKAALCRES